MVRFIALATAALVLAAVPLGTAEARAHKRPAAESAHGHGKKKPEPRAKAHGRGRHAEDDYDEAPRPRRGAHGRQTAEEHCATTRGRHGRRTVCTPVRASRDDRYDDAPPRRAARPQSYARNDAPAPVRPAPKSIDEALEAALNPPPAPAQGAGTPGGYTPTPQVTAPPPPPPLAPDSPAAKVKHANPAPGIVVVTNPDIWAERRQAEHRNRAAATRLTLSTMVGRSDTDLRSALGVPDLQRTEGDGALWTYRMPTCSLMVFLHRAEGVDFKVTGAQAGPLARGGPAPNVDDCLRTSGSR